MVLKTSIFMICTLELAQAGIIATNYSPVVSPVYSLNPTVVKTVSSPILTQTINGGVYSSGPYYESIVTTHESKQKSLDGSQHSSFSKTLDTTFSKVNKFESHTSNDGVLIAQTIPAIHSANTIYRDNSFSLSHPIGYNTPIVTKILKKTETDTPASTTHFAPVVSSPIVTKSVSTPLLYSSPENNVILAHNTPVKTAIAYSPTPLVAHASFTGLGTSYTW